MSNPSAGAKRKLVLSSTSFISKPGQSQGLLYKHLCASFIHLVSHSVMVCENIFMTPPGPNDGAFSHKKDYLTIFKEIFNHEGHPNRNTGSNVTAILLNG